MNKIYLDAVLNGEKTDYLYHFGISSSDSLIKEIKNIKAIILTGSAVRTKRMLKTFLKTNKIKHFITFPKKERFSTYYTKGVLFSSHGMGMPSMSIALEELMKLVYYAKEGNLKNVKDIFWARVGTSGGLVDAGTIVLSTVGLCSNFKPYKLFVLGKNFEFDSSFPLKTIKDILKANSEYNINITSGKTVGANTFYLEQNRTDGALSLFGENEKLHWLNKAVKLGVKNIEMEAPMMAGFLNFWGFKNFSDICCVLLNRLVGDQVSSSKKDLEKYSIDAEKVLFNYLKTIL